MSTPQATLDRPQKGFGAGAGAALAMIAVMAVLRFSFGVPSIPELLQGAFLRLVPGDLFEFMIHLLGPGAKVLLLVSVLEGMVLVGGVLGWLFVRNWRRAGTVLNQLETTNGMFPLEVWRYEKELARA